MTTVNKNVLTRSSSRDLSFHEPYQPVQNEMIPISRQHWIPWNPHYRHQLSNLSMLCVVYVHARNDKTKAQIEFQMNVEIKIIDINLIRLKRNTIDDWIYFISINEKSNNKREIYSRIEPIYDERLLAHRKSIGYKWLLFKDVPFSSNHPCAHSRKNKVVRRTAK